jgi:hypothetical protein
MTRSCTPGCVAGTSTSYRRRDGCACREPCGAARAMRLLAMGDAVAAVPKAAIRGHRSGRAPRAPGPFGQRSSDGSRAGGRRVRKRPDATAETDAEATGASRSKAEIYMSTSRSQVPVSFETLAVTRRLPEWCRVELSGCAVRPRSSLTGYSGAPSVNGAPAHDPQASSRPARRPHEDRTNPRRPADPNAGTNARPERPPLTPTRTPDRPNRRT